MTNDKSYKWISTILSILAIVISIFALYESHRSNEITDKWNELNISGKKPKFILEQKSTYDEKEHVFYTDYRIKNVGNEVKELKYKISPKVILQYSNLDTSYKFYVPIEKIYEVTSSDKIEYRVYKNKALDNFLNTIEIFQTGLKPHLYGGSVRYLIKLSYYDSFNQYNTDTYFYDDNHGLLESYNYYSPLTMTLLDEKSTSDNEFSINYMIYSYNLQCGDAEKKAIYDVTERVYEEIINILNNE